jgi:hypothetical protein
MDATSYATDDVQPVPEAIGVVDLVVKQNGSPGTDGILLEGQSFTWSKSSTTVRA